MATSVDQTPFSKGELLRRMRAGWDDINRYLNTLTEEQMTKPTDAAGWTVKDHIIHLAMWENGMTGLLNRQPRWEAMGVDKETWEKHDTDGTNAEIQRRYHSMPLAQVLQTFQDSHRGLVAKIESMDEADLLKSYGAYEPPETDDQRPVWHWIVGNTFMHYYEHRPWMEAIVKG
jgi:uncharacterized protein (TIGR03083 family)